MPLLGRHKSNPSSASQSPSPPATIQQSPALQAAGGGGRLCESPLFGIRRQLPTVLPEGGSTNYNNSSDNNLARQHTQQTGSSNKQQQQQQLQSVNSNNNSGLSSIPQQITRQQIHYAFTIMDTNSDGQVDVRDLSQMLSNLGIPIDEAILAHIMKNTVSKRGDHRISEAEFLDWISHFIQIRSESPTGATGETTKKSTTASGKTAVRVTRSSTAGSSLVAETGELPRNRRGSGSGLALMRSLSSSNASSSSSSSSSKQMEKSNETTRSKTRAKLQQQSSTDSAEAKNDLKAAFCVFDLDGDGYITLDEVRAGLKLLGESWSPMELRRVFSRCGANSAQTDLSKQRISIDDFVQLLL